MVVAGLVPAIYSRLSTFFAVSTELPVARDKPRLDEVW